MLHLWLAQREVTGQAHDRSGTRAHCHTALSGTGVPPLDIANGHIVDTSRLAPATQLSRLATHLQPLDYCITFMLGDFNFLTPGEGRLDVTTGVHTYLRRFAGGSGVPCHFSHIRKSTR